MAGSGTMRKRASPASTFCTACSALCNGMTSTHGWIPWTRAKRIVSSRRRDRRLPGQVGLFPLILPLAVANWTARCPSPPRPRTATRPPTGASAYRQALKVVTPAPISATTPRCHGPGSRAYRRGGLARFRHLHHKPRKTPQAFTVRRTSPKLGCTTGTRVMLSWRVSESTVAATPVIAMWRTAVLREFRIACVCQYRDNIRACTTGSVSTRSAMSER